MALPLQITITGTVTADIVRVVVGSSNVPITDGRYEVTVPVSQQTVAITSIDAAGGEWTRTVQMSAVAGAPG